MSIKENISKHYGEGARLKKAADPLLVKTAYAHDCEDAEVLLPYLTIANIAHLLVLKKGDIVPKDEAIIIMRALKTIENYKQQEFTLDPSNGDIYNNFDIALQNIIGEKSGWLHTGRPRREAVNVAFMLCLREKILETVEATNNLLSILAQKCEENLNTLMPDFTYLQHAQPTTFAHYLLTFTYPLKRDIERLFEVFERVNSSWGESGSVNGSRLPLDKKYFAKLLGYSNISIHSRDAMWQPDIPLEAIGIHISILTNLTRFAEELLIWNTEEFNYVELPDSLCRASVIMPQKKNPYPLTYFRGLTNSIIPKYSAYASYGRIMSGNPDSRIFIYGDLVKTISKVNDALSLFGKIIDEMELNKKLLKEKIITSDAYATDIADFLILTKKVNYREAHHIVGQAYQQLISINQPLTKLTPSILKSCIKKVTDQEIEISSLQLKELFDPQKIVDSRKTLGGACASQVTAMIDTIKITNKENNNKFENILNKLQQNENFFKEEIEKLNEK